LPTARAKCHAELPSCAPISEWAVQRRRRRRWARAARAPKAISLAASCDTSLAAPSAEPRAASLTCSSVKCPQWGSVAWVPPLTDGDGQDSTTNAFKLPSFAAPNTSSATSCAKSFACVLHVPPKGRRGGTRVFGVGSELAGGDGQDTRPPPHPPRRLGSAAWRWRMPR